MRLLRIGPQGQERPCAVHTDGTVRDLSAWVRDWSGAALDPGRLRELDERLAREGTQLPVAGPHERVGPPVRPGGHVLSIGLNYRAHAAEAGMDVPAEPYVSSKAPSTVVGPFDDLVIPPGSRKTDWEVELAVIIGRRGQYLPGPQHALDHVAGFCTADDVSERGWLLERGGQWIKGKSFETFTPLGPHLVTPDEVGDLRSLRLTCHVNGRQMQDGHTGDMVFDVAHVVWYLSQFLVLHPGDVVLTGSPAGISLARPDVDFLRPGDLLEVEVGGLGAQRQRCRAFDGKGETVAVPGSTGGPMIEEVVPRHVAGHEAYGDPVAITLYPEEEAVARRFAAPRRAAFTTGRHCAHRALADLGVPPGAIMRSPGGAPRWPASVVGSITHCDGYRAAAVASRARARAVGIDAEPNREVPEDVLEFISAPQECLRVRELIASRPEVRWDRLLFCVKESVYKVWHPVTGQFLGFREAEVDFAADTAAFDVRLRPRCGWHQHVPETLHGRWTSRDGLLLTAITLPVP